MVVPDVVPDDDAVLAKEDGAVAVIASFTQ